ncbi:cation-transporting ATPase E [Arcanobacterium pluranimalium]|uniref:HAD-IC family P-type ATPase n=1 Tax=Arcanobacterium pluranimalium TaxID=108028 RepID=UPI00195A7794|nr:HAD-IC family P-type ATPase [Arcanobacterium pluranimalium]MBM7824535.1 cation-transporting ATPase E [Arcanobacterium pluranimalium]
MTSPVQAVHDPHYAQNGLSTKEVKSRFANGQVNKLPPRSGKTVKDIVRDNVCTRINAILSVLFVMVIVTGSWINSAFGMLIVVNSLIGIVQELRAKSTLESLSLIGEEHPTVVRDGEERQVTQEELVLDDVVVIKAGNQIVVDGEVLAADYLAVDESMLTGESDPVVKEPGDPIVSGSFVVVGTGKFRVSKVGAQSYAAQIAAQASKFTLHKSQLQAGIDSILKYITMILVPVGILTIIAQVRQDGSADWREVILAITGALVPMVPEGLILITSTAFALGVIRLGKRKCLVQELPAIEGLARVDVVCADKTGTLTENTLEFSQLVALNGSDTETYREALAQLVWADPDPNATTQALCDAFEKPANSWEVRERKPFSSTDKWAGISFQHDDAVHGFVFGAPDVLDPDAQAGNQAEEYGNQGLRVLLFGKVNKPFADVDIARDVTPLALVLFDQKLRDDVPDTLAYFAEQEVNLKIISGDNAKSVAAVTRRLGVDVGETVDARTLTDPASFGQTIEDAQVFGRVTPAQKKEMVHALQERGHTVAMTGDGVNDVLALKDADIGVAMGTGSSAARSVAKIVLLDNKFATLPYVVGEGRRVIGNIERVANLFLTKTIYSVLIATLVLLSNIPFPFQPIHVSITGWFTIGIPAFFLALPPNNQRARDGFVRRVLSFAAPAGVIVGLCAFTAYMVVSGGHVPARHVQESTAALAALIVPATWVVALIARPWNWWKILLLTLPLVAYSIIFTCEFTQRLFVLDSSNETMMLTGLGIGFIGAICVEVLWHLVGKKNYVQE